MELSAYAPAQFDEVIRLFTDVFADSEGQQEGQLVGQLVSELITTHPESILGYVGLLNGRVIGSIFFSRLMLPSGKLAFILSPLAVSSQHQGKGLGQQLIHFGIHQLRQRGVELIFTYGDPGFYSKAGFMPISEEVIKAPKSLTYPEGWLAQSLNNARISPEAGSAQCVEALNKQKYW